MLMAALTRSMMSKPLCSLCRGSLLAGPSTAAAAKPGLRLLGARLSGTAASAAAGQPQKAVGYWMLGVAGMAFVQVTLGGLTRLTESGLSMVDWHLIKGMRPPTSQADWEAEFAKYKAFPEYQYKQGEHEMSLNEFKFIWSMEYGHRMWGRTIGLAFLLPAGYFWLRGRLDRGLKKRVLAIGTLLVGQGLFGWYMVKSGLDPKDNSNKDIPRVSQYRLAGHLSMAVIFYTLCLWNGLSQVTGALPQVIKPVDYSLVAGAGRLRGLAHATKTSIFLTIVAGAFVAGLDAGLTYNSWPKYADAWIPSDLAAQSPGWRNVFENPTTVQFNHRNLAYVSLALVSATWLAGRRVPLAPRARAALNSLLVLAYAQASLGIVTLLHYVPVGLAAAHQTGSMVVISAAFWLAHELRRLPKP